MWLPMHDTRYYEINNMKWTHSIMHDTNEPNRVLLGKTIDAAYY